MFGAPAMTVTIIMHAQRNDVVASQHVFAPSAKRKHMRDIGERNHASIFEPRHARPTRRGRIRLGDTESNSAMAIAIEIVLAWALMIVAQWRRSQAQRTMVGVRKHFAWRPSSITP
jgi:hypothetical protein